MSSPLPKDVKPTTLNFIEAMQKILNGEKVRRIEWPEGEYAFISDGFIKINKNGIHAWLIGDGDYGAIDWIIIN